MRAAIDTENSTVKRMIDPGGTASAAAVEGEQRLTELGHDAPRLGEVLGQRTGAAVHRHRAGEDQLRSQVPDAGRVEGPDQGSRAAGVRGRVLKTVESAALGAADALARQPKPRWPICGRVSGGPFTPARMEIT